MPVLPASDGKDYEFPEGTSASVAMKFLNTKGLSLRLPNAQVTGEFDPNIPSPAVPIGMLGGRGVTTGDVGQMQAAAATGEKALRQGVGTAAAIAPFAVAAPFTGGASIPAAAGIMGLAGLTGGGLSQITDKVFGGENKSAGKIASEVVLNGLFGAGSELGLGVAMKYGAQPLAGVLMRAANKSAQGQMILTKMTQDAYGALNTSVAGRTADPTPVYKAFLRGIEKIPVGEGPVVSKLAGKVGGTVGELISQVRAAMESDPLVSDPSKPLDLLIRMHSEANQIAFSPMKDVPAAARAVAKDFAMNLRGLVTRNLGPAERKLFEAAKSLDSSQREFSAGQEAARFLARKLVLGTAGAVVGHGAGGAAAAVTGDVALQWAEQKAAPAILEHMVTRNRAAYQKAIKLVQENPEDLPKIVSGMQGALLRGVPAKALTEAASSMFPEKEAPDAAQVGP